LGFTPSKLNLGFAFYAKFFKTTGQCSQPIGCPTAVLEATDGSDTGLSGAVTFREVPPILSRGIADTAQGGQVCLLTNIFETSVADAITVVLGSLNKLLLDMGHTSVYRAKVQRHYQSSRTRWR
jgi:hypothetical protein